MAHMSPGSETLSLSYGLDRGWQARYIRCRQNYRTAKATIRLQAAKSRQLIAVVTDQLQRKDREIKKIRETHDRELNAICQQLYFLHGCLIRERDRVISIVQEKDRVIQQQRLENDRLGKTATIGSGTGSGPTLDRVRPGSGSIRLHGSFRQYKKEKIRQKNVNSSSESNLSCSTGWIASSEESSESSPRQVRPPLRLTLSSGSVESHSLSFSEQKQSLENLRPRKGILKTSSSYGNLSSSSSPNLSTSGPDLEVLENLQNLLRANTLNDFAPSIVKSLLVGSSVLETHSANTLVTGDIGKREDRSDSGRESEDQSSLEPSFSRPSSILSSSSSSGIITDSPNSSFDASDPTTKVVIEIRKTKPPAPPPRSSTTRLSTDSSAETPSPNRRGSAGDALDCLIYDSGDPVPPSHARPPLLKKVKFHPNVDCQSTVKPLDPNFLHFLPKLGSDSSDKPIRISGITYFEPYL